MCSLLCSDGVIVPCSTEQAARFASIAAYLSEDVGGEVQQFPVLFDAATARRMLAIASNTSTPLEVGAAGKVGWVHPDACAPTRRARSSTKRARCMHGSPLSAKQRA